MIIRFITKKQKQLKYTNRNPDSHWETIWSFGLKSKEVNKIWLLL
jgi:hypothetical protein